MAGRARAANIQGMRRTAAGHAGWRPAALIHCLAVALALVAAFPGGAGLAAPRCQFAGLEEAKAMAERAAALLERVGPRAALPAFMEPAGAFIDRDLYVFVMDLDGRIWASGGFPETVGSDASLAQDSQGRFFVHEMIRVARERGAGWVEYEWYNPCTRELSHKVTFFKRVGPLIVAVGAYGTLSA